MPAVCAAHGGNVRCVARDSQPVMDRGAYFPAFHGRIPVTVMPGYQENHPRSAIDAALERVVDRRPGAVERHPVEIQREIWIDVS